LVHTVDLVPTVLSAVGLSKHITPRMRGVDLMHSARGERPLDERPACGAIYPNDAQILGAPSQHVRGRWIRHGDFKLIVPGQAANPLPLSLFDLSNDPQEHSNLAELPANRQRIDHLRELLDTWWAARDDRSVTRPEEDA
jgi:arylsulfatase A-like enzyme